MPTQSQNPIEPQPDIVGVIQTGLVAQEQRGLGPWLELCHT